MKTYKEEVTVNKIIHETICNFCGKPALFIDSGGYVSRNWSCEIKVDWQNHGSFPGQQAGISTSDICQDCYASKLKPLMILPVNETIWDQDSGQKIVRP